MLAGDVQKRTWPSPVEYHLIGSALCPCAARGAGCRAQLEHVQHAQLVQAVAAGAGITGIAGIVGVSGVAGVAGMASESGASGMACAGPVDAGMRPVLARGAAPGAACSVVGVVVCFVVVCFFSSLNSSI